jgi:hypothetical protein
MGIFLKKMIWLHILVHILEMSGFLKRTQIFENHLLDDDDDDNSGSSDESSDDDEEIDFEEDVEEDNNEQTRIVESISKDGSSDTSYSSSSDEEEERITNKNTYFSSQAIQRSETVEMISSDSMPPPPPPPPPPVQVNYVFGRSKKNAFKWQTVPNFDSNKTFYESFGPRLNEPFKHLKTVDQFFSSVFTDQLLEKIVFYTNESLNLKYGEKVQEPISLNELKAFIGLLITFGITKKRKISVEKIWKPNSIHWCPVATGAMSRNRFQFIFKNICFDDKRTRNERKKENRKFYKMEECYLIFKNNLNKILNPSSKLCIDECLYACKCRCAFIQFMKNKPRKFGIKYWCLVDVSTGVLIDFNIYLGIISFNISSSLLKLHSYLNIKEERQI